MAACRAWRFLLVTAVLFLTAAVCHAGPAGTGSATAEQTPSAAAEQKVSQLIPIPIPGPSVGQKLSVTTARDWLGRTISFSQYRGRPLALWFENAATCGYCVLEAQSYGALSKQLEAIGVNVAGVNVHEGQRDVLEYLKRARWEGTVLVEPPDLDPDGYPTDMVLSPDGTVVQQLSGVTPEETFVAAAAQLSGAGKMARYHIPGGLKLADNMTGERESLYIVGSEAEKQQLEKRMEEIRQEGVSRGYAFQVPRVKLAGEVTEQDLGRYPLSVVGTPASNPFFARLEGRSPVRFLEDGVEIGGKAYRGKGIGWGVCFPNPWNPSKYLLVGGGWSDADYYVTDRDSYRGSGGMAVWYDRPVVKGFFDKSDPTQWRYSPRLVAARTAWQEPLVKSTPADGTPDIVWPAGAGGPAPAPARVAWSAARAAGAGMFPAVALTGSAAWVASARGGAVYVQRLGERAAQRVSGAGDAYGPALAADRAGRAWVAWTEQRDGFYRILVAHSTRRGWSAPELGSPSDLTDDDHAAVIVTSQGDVCVSWYRWRANSRSVFLRVRHADGTWEPAEPVSDGMFTWWPSLAQDRSGLIWASWTQHYPNGIFVGFRDPKKGWQASLLAQDRQHPQLIAGRAPAVVWEEGVDGSNLWEPRGTAQRRIAFSRLEGGKWRDPVSITPADWDARNPSLAQDASGRLFVAFEAREQPTASWQVYVIREQPSGWGQPVRLSQGPVDSRSPAITTGDGKVLVAWHRGNGTDWEIETALGEISSADPGGEADTCAGGICQGH